MPVKPDAFIILTPGFPASENDSTCLPLQQYLVKMLAAARPGINIIVLSFQYPYHTQTYRWHNVEVHCFNGRNKGGLARLLRERKIYGQLKSLQAVYTIRGLLSFWYGECALVGKHFADKNGLQHRCWILGQDARAANPYPKKAKAEAGELIALSDFLQEEFQRNFNIRPAQVITPEVDTGLFLKEEPQRDIDILGVGSLIPLKRFDWWIDCISLLKVTHPEIKAVLIGDGVERRKLEKLAQELNLAENIRFAGELPYPAVLQMMQRAKILLHPSSYEGYSGVCQEALYAGAQVISFCRPMKEDIEGWHIVNDKPELVALAGKMLAEEQDTPAPVQRELPGRLVKNMLAAFSLSE